ncbi:MAG: FAD-dependent oxidoreductase [Desulfarculaceae bacterium]
MVLAPKKALVLGGGIAGVTAALSLARAGVGVDLVEKDDFIGGYAASLACKALDQCQKCNGCLAEARLRQALVHADIKIHRRATLASLSQQGRGFKAMLTQQPAYIDPAECTLCGLCLQECPMAEEGAIRRSPLPFDQTRLAIDPEVCLYFKDRKSTLCRDVCPEEAIDFRQEPRELVLEADVLVLATGYRPYAAQKRERLAYGRVPNVITGMELEAMLRRHGRVLRPSDGIEPRRVAFIQCVGSRDRQGHNYCSRVCCAYGLRLGRTLRHRFGAEVSIFYMDWQSFGHDFDRFLDQAREELELIRAMPYDVSRGQDGEVKLSYQAQAGQALETRAYDLLVLCVGITPGEDNAGLAQTMDTGLNQHGFLLSSPSRGVFVAGTAGRPLDVAETVAQAGRAAQEALHYLEEN